jgi:hypothetical protein
MEAPFALLLFCTRLLGKCVPCQIRVACCCMKTILQSEWSLSVSKFRALFNRRDRWKRLSTASNSAHENQELKEFCSQKCRLFFQLCPRRRLRACRGKNLFWSWITRMERFGKGSGKLGSSLKVDMNPTFQEEYSQVTKMGRRTGRWSTHTDVMTLARLLPPPASSSSSSSLEFFYMC